MPDSTDIDLFKEDICATLSACSERIDLLRAEMEELADSSEGTLRELDSMKNRAHTTVSQYQQCELCATGAGGGDAMLLGKQFYLFPCSHGFHGNCLLRHAPRHMEPPQLSALRKIEEQIHQLTSPTGGTASTAAVAALDGRGRAQLDALQAELDGYVGADCPLCGFATIRSLRVSLITEEDTIESKAWAL